MDNISCHHRLRTLLLFACIVFGMLTAAVASVLASDYLLGAGDRIQVTVFGREDLSGIYTVRDTGRLSLPLIGEVEASDKTLAMLEEAIAATYADRTNSGVGPTQTFHVNLEIVTHRPFYILGDVQKPGRYEFESGLTVLRAVAIAGGYASSSPDGRVDETRARENLDVLRSRYVAGVAREARLVAEHGGLERIRFPDGIEQMRDDPFVAEILELETQLFNVRRDLLSQELEIIAKRRQQYGEENRALRAQSAAVELKRKEVDKLLQATDDLITKGVLPMFELSSLVIMQADVERESREIIVHQSRARQGVSEMEQQALILRGEREREIANELEKAGLELNEILSRLQWEAARLSILEVRILPTADTGDQSTLPAIRITRTAGEETTNLAAGVNDPILPGDVVTVPNQTGAYHLSLPGRVTSDASPTTPVATTP